MRSYEEQYLLQYKVCTDEIFNLLEEAKNISYLQAICYDRPKVQSSKGQSPTERQAMKLTEVDEKITMLFNKRSQIEQTIKEIENPIERYILDEFSKTGTFRTDVISPKDIGKYKKNALAHFGEILRLKGGEQVEENYNKTEYSHQ